MSTILKRFIHRIIVVNIYILLFSGCMSAQVQHEISWDWPEPSDLMFTERVLIRQDPLSFLIRVTPEEGVVFPAKNNDLIPVCVEFRMTRLLELGDNLYSFENYNLWIDTDLQGEADFVFRSALPAVYTETFDGESGIGPYYVTACWEIRLDAGIHLATIAAWTSVGEEHVFHWAFEIEEWRGSYLPQQGIDDSP